MTSQNILSHRAPPAPRSSRGQALDAALIQHRFPTDSLDPIILRMEKETGGALRRPTLTPRRQEEESEPRFRLKLLLEGFLNILVQRCE